MAKQYFGEKALRALTRLVQTALGTKVDNASIVNDLTSVDATKVLSAAQGKALKDAMDTQKTELQNAIDAVGGAEGLDKKLDADKVGVADGVAPLDSNGLVGSQYLPSYVDDVIEGYYDADTNKFYEEEAKTTELKSETGKIYIDLPTNISYRYGGSTFVPITSSDLVEINETDVENIWNAGMTPPAPTEYTITLAATENGTVSTTPADKAAADTEVTVVPAPAEGYEVATVVVTDEDSGNVDVSAENKFTMPAKNVTVTVTFSAVSEG